MDKSPRNSDEKIPQNPNDVAEFLKGPKKKKKTYIILATEKGFNPDISTGIKRFVQSQYNQFSISMPETSADLSRQLGRNISLLIISDQLDDLDVVMTLVASLKEKRKNETIPVLFLTNNSAKLISYYHTHLAAFQEVDEYIDYQKSDLQQILSRVKTGLDTKNRRRSRRYPISMAATFFYLNKDMVLPCEIIDLSIHGALIKTPGECIFRVQDQLKLNIPVAKFLTLESGDFLKISARVKRVFIAGNVAGISFEYLSDKQASNLTKLVTSIANHDLKLKSLKGTA
jgi:hypothetical protein